jgi:precorrin-3B synthase
VEAVGNDDPVAQRPASDPLATLGPDPQGGWLGAAFPFGALDAEQLGAVAELVDPAAEGTLRLTPWRALLLTGAHAGAEQALDRLGAVTDGADNRLKLSACIGAPGCQAGQTATRTDARAMAAAADDLLAAGGRLHVSGCDKWCGDPAAATVVVTAAPEGYELAVSDGAMAETVAYGLSPQTARRWLTGFGRVLAAAQQPGERVDETVKRLGPTALAERAQREAGHDR